MATYFARKSGNINATDVWATTPTGTAANVFSTFTSSDVLVANSFTITINVNATIGEIRNDTTGGATNGGTYTLSGGVTLTTNIINGGSTTVLSYSANGTSNIIGTINGQSGSSVCINMSGSGILNITGNVFGVNGAGSQAINFTGTSSLNITGNVYGGLNNGEGIRNSSTTGTINITGNVIGGDVGGATSIGAYLYGSNGVGTGIINITGTVTGGIVSVGASLLCGTMNIIGTSVGGVGAVGSSNTSTLGILNVKRAKGNGFGNGSAGLTAQVGVSSGQNSTTRVEEIEYGDLGQSPTSGPVQLLGLSSNVCLVYRTGGLGKKTLIDSAASVGAFPSASNVRSGIAYNNGNSTGTMAVPSASSVAYGVSVDNTTGTAVLTPSDVWNHQTSSATTSGSIGERLKNCSTIASVGQQLANALSPQ